MVTVHRGWLRPALTIAALAGSLALGGCAHGSTHVKPTVNATEQAELDQGKKLVVSCFPGTLVQQVRTVHLVFLSSATGKNGPQVVSARDKVFGCLGINDPARRTAFINDAGEAALHAKPSLARHDGRVQYFTVTLPKIVLKYGGNAGGVGTSTARPSIPGTSASSAPVSPAPSTKASTP